MRVLSPRGGSDDDDDGDGEEEEAITTYSSSRRRRKGSGPAAALAWSPCGGAVAVGWARGGVCCWTRSGCRLFSSRAVSGAAVEEEEEEEAEEDKKEGEDSTPAAPSLPLSHSALPPSLLN